MNIDEIYETNKKKIHNIIQKKYINHYNNLKDIMQEVYLIMKEKESTFQFDSNEQFIAYAVKVAYSVIKKIQSYDKIVMIRDKFYNRDEYRDFNNEDDMIYGNYENLQYETDEQEIDYNILYSIAFNELKNLTLLEEAIVKARIYSKATFTELSKSLGIERTKVFRIHKEALRKLKEMVLEKYDNIDEWN